MRTRTVRILNPCVLRPICEMIKKTFIVQPNTLFDRAHTQHMEDKELLGLCVPMFFVVYEVFVHQTTTSMAISLLEKRTFLLIAY